MVCIAPQINWTPYVFKGAFFRVVSEPHYGVAFFAIIQIQPHLALDFLKSPIEDAPSVIPAPYAAHVKFYGVT